VGAEGHGDATTCSRISREQDSRKSASALGLEQEDLFTDEVGEEIGVVILVGPGAVVRYEGTAGDRGVACIVAGRRLAFSGSVHRAGVTGVIVPALAKVPAVIRADRSTIDLLPACALMSFSTRLELFDTEIEINNSQVRKRSWI
jgi:hypothetical protein